MNILICDDEEVVRTYLADIMHDAGHTTLLAKDGAEGLRIVKDIHVDLVLTDIRMPHVDGLELLRQINSLPVSPGVLLMTAYAEFQAAVEALREGAIDIVMKPVERAGILHHIHRYDAFQRMKREAKRAREQASYSARMAAVGKLSAGISHEINNPLTFIRGNAELVKCLLEAVKAGSKRGEAVDPLTELLLQGPALLETIIRGSDRIANIVKGLEAFANTDVREARSETALEVCLEDALLFIEFEAGEPSRPYQLIRHAETAIPHLSLSRRSVTQAILCLLLNARQEIRDKPDGVIRTALFQDAGRVCLAIEDNGRGVPPAMRERIFEPFFTTKDIREGTGLGLSMAYGIIDQDHNGRIIVEESDLGGARFVLSFPHDLVICREDAPDNPAETRQPVLQEGAL